MKVQWKKQSGPLLVSSFTLFHPKRGRREPTMTRATRRAEYTGPAAPCLYLAFELGSAEWKLGFTTEPGATPRVRTMPARDLARLTREIADAQQWFGVKAATPVRSCYEAGRDGFWLHRYLISIGIANVIVDSSSIEVNRRLRRAKSDRLDARKLLGMLLRYHAGEQKVWSVVRVPTALRARLEREWEHAQFWRTRIRELERARQRAIAHGHGEALAKVRQLLRLRAVGPGSAWVYVNEFFGWRRFRNRKEVGAAAGLTPTPYQSGDGHREQGISKAGNRHIRAVAIELAWGWLRYQPRSRLSRWYQARFGRGGPRARQVGIVALARKLLIELWRFLELGVVPEGARLKTA